MTCDIYAKCRAITVHLFCGQSLSTQMVSKEKKLIHLDNKFNAMGLGGLPIRCQTDIQLFFYHSRKAKIGFEFHRFSFPFYIKASLFHKYILNTFAISYRSKAISRQKVQLIRIWQPWKDHLTGQCTAQAYETCYIYDDENHNHLIIDSTLALGGV